MKTLRKQILTKAILPALSLDEQEMLHAEKKRAIDTSVIIRKDITGAGSTHEVLDATVEQLNNVSDFNRKQLSQPVALDRISVRFSEGTAALGVTGVKYSNKSSDVSAALQNSILRIRQNSKVLADLNISSMISALGSDKNAQEIALRLDNPVVLASNTDIEMELVFAAGATASTTVTNGAVFFEFAGYGIKVVSA